MAVLTGEVIKAVAEFVLDDGSIIQNIFHFACVFVAEQAEALVVAAVKGYIEDIYAAIDAYISDTVTVNDFNVHVVEWDVSEQGWEVVRFVGADTPAITFTSLDDPLPNQMAAVLVANTYRPKSRGRKFLVPFVETAALAGDLIGAALTALGIALNHYLADENISIGNDLSPGVPRAGVETFLIFSDGVVNSILGTQRRRKPGIGA